MAEGGVIETCTERKRRLSSHQPVGRWIRADKRLATCLLCGRDLHNAEPREVTLDHITPKSKGGSNESTNLYTCCGSCNSSRQDTPLIKFAGREANALVRKHARRSIRRQRKLAKSIIAGETTEILGGTK